MPKQNNQSKHPSRSGRLAGLIPLVVALALATLFALGALPRMRQSRKLAEDVKGQAESRRQVVVTRPHAAPDTDLSLPGTTEAIEDTVIGARTSGYVSKRYVDIGARVKAGQVLAEIESPDVDQQLYQADAQTAQSRAQVDQAKADVSNKQATVAQLKSAVRQAEANLEQARANVSDEEAKLQQLKAAKSVAQAQLLQAQHQVDIKKAALNQANTSRDLAQITFRRYDALVAKGFVAQQEVDQYKAAYDNSVAAVGSAEADVNAADANVVAARELVASSDANIKAGEAELRSAQKNVLAIAATVEASKASVDAGVANVRLSRSNVSASIQNVRASVANGHRYTVLTSFEKVTAPFDGVITARNVEVGNLISAGGGSSSGGSGSSGSSSSGNVVNAGSASTSSATPNSTSGSGLFGVCRTDTMRIFVSLPQSYTRVVRLGMRARLVLEKEYPGRSFVGTVARMSGAIDVTSRTLLTEIHVDNRDGALLPGMYAQVHFDVPHSTNAWRVPSAAVVFDSQGERVATIGSDNVVHFVPVKVGSDYGTELEIVSGLNGTEQIAAAPADDLAEGEPVKPVEQVKPK